MTTAGVDSPARRARRAALLPLVVLAGAACAPSEAPQPEAHPAATSSAVASAPASSARAAAAASASASPRVAAVPAPPLRSLDCNSYFGCSVREDGRVACFGFNQFGQLGKGKLAYPGKAREIVPIPEARAVAVGFTHACALTRAGEIFCWGSESSGALGDGAPPPADGAPTRIVAPTKVVGLERPAVDLDADSSHTCAVLEDGTAACWGSSAGGVFGAATVDLSSRPLRIEGVRGAVEIATSEDQTCVRDGAGAVTCWGGRARAPAPIAGVCARQIGTIGASVCAVACEGGVRCWGALPGYDKQADVPTEQPALKDVVEIRGGASHYVFRDGAGQVLAWGSNDSGQIGNGKPASWEQAFADEPVTLKTTWRAAAVCAGGILKHPDSRHLRPATWIDAGRSCARTIEGDVYCWGEPDVDYVPKRVELPR